MCVIASRLYWFSGQLLFGTACSMCQELKKKLCHFQFPGGLTQPFPSLPSPLLPCSALYEFLSFSFCYSHGLTSFRNRCTLFSLLWTENSPGVNHFTLQEKEFTIFVSLSNLFLQRAFLYRYSTQLPYGTW